jgi:hypothetical protein
MDTYKRAGRAHKSASKQALRELGVPEPDLKAAGARERCMPKPKIAKGRTLEEQQRIDADNAAMAAAARRRAQALRQEQQARRRALAQAKQALARAGVPAPDMHAEPNTQARMRAGKRTQNTPPQQTSMHGPGASA